MWEGTLVNASGLARIAEMAGEHLHMDVACCDDRDLPAVLAAIESVRFNLDAAEMVARERLAGLLGGL